MKGFKGSVLSVFRPSTCGDYAGAQEDGAVYETRFLIDALADSNEFGLGDLEELAKVISNCFNGNEKEFCIGAINDEGIFYPIDLLIKMAKDGI